MKLSVAMCTYDGAAYLLEQLESIAAQTRPPDELIICDDRSHDETAEIVREFAARASFPVRLQINEHKLGSTKNFERAIRLCAGEVIALSDQDDVWLPEKLARLEAVFIAKPQVGLVFSDGEIVDEKLHPAGERLWQRIGLNRPALERIRRGGALEVLLPGWTVTGATMAVRSAFRDFFLPIPDDLALIHDGWIAAAVAALAEVEPVAECLILYRQHQRQQVGARAPAAIDAGIRAALTRVNAYADQTAITARLNERLASQSSLHPRPGVRRMLEDRCAHLRARASLPQRKMRRLPGIIRELLTGRYHRYSRGISSAAKDLVSEATH